MASPSYRTLYEEISNRINLFYDKASILVDNKYIVGLYGDNIEKAVRKMRKASGERQLQNKKETKKIFEQRVDRPTNTTTPVLEPALPENTYSKMLKRWESIFLTINDGGVPDEVELRWAVKNVKIPTVKPVINTDFSLDHTKNLWYPVVTGLQKTDKVTLTIVEERGMGMYQFFNALMNEFYFTRVLKPKSSFHKLAMYVIILNGEYIKSEAGLDLANFNVANPRSKLGLTEEKTHIIDIPLQVFEFNSIVPTDIGSLTFKADSPSLVTFDVTFEAPNIFQGSYKSTTMKGLMDGTTDSSLFNSAATDKNEILDTVGEYKHDVFTLKDSQLKGQLTYADTSVKIPKPPTKKQRKERAAGDKRSVTGNISDFGRNQVAGNIE